MTITPRTNELYNVPTSKLKFNHLSEKIYSTPVNYNEIRENIKLLGGVLQPLLVNISDYKVISGNLRLRIAKDLNIKTLPVIFLDLTEYEISVLLLSANKQREKSTLDKYRELQLINKLTGISKGSRTDLKPHLKVLKIEKDKLKKGLTVYQINSFTRINKIANKVFGKDYISNVERELMRIETENRTLNSVVKMFESLLKPKKIQKKSEVKLTPKKAIHVIRKVLDKLSSEQRQEVLDALKYDYSLKMVS